MATKPGTEPEEQLNFDIDPGLQTKVEEIARIFGPPADQFDFQKVANAALDVVKTPGLDYGQKLHNERSLDAKDELRKLTRAVYSETSLASLNDDQKAELPHLVAAKAAYILNCSLSGDMGAERMGGNPHAEGHLQRILSMKGIEDGLSGDIMYGKQGFPAELNKLLKLELNGKNPDGEDEFRAYCKQLGLDEAKSSSALKTAVQIQSIKDPEMRKAKLDEIYKKPTSPKSKMD